jgi:hypothetical protein
LSESNKRILNDRRRQPTPALSKFTLQGRRGSFRRKEDRERGGYVDRYGSGLLFLIVLIAGLNILDALFTMIILADGGVEMNPIVRNAIQIYGDKFWIWKFVMVSVPLILLCLHNKFRLAIPAMVGISAVYAIVVLFQVFLIIC